MLIWKLRAVGGVTYLDDGSSIPEPGLEEDIGIGKQALFERDDDKLTAFEPGLE